MKKVTFLFLILTVTLGSCIIDGWDTSISGNGVVVEEERDVSDFTGIHISTGIDVFLSEGDFKVVVEADENLMEVILTEVRDDMLVVKTDHVNIRHAKSKKVHVTLPELEKLKISSAGDCEGQGSFKCSDLSVDISSAGDLTLDVDARSIRLDISSSGDARISGSTDFLDASLSSAGDLHAFDLVARTVEVSASSAGDARVHATEEISMNASSAGSIYYMGEAEVVRSSKSSAGDIVKRN